MDKIKMNLVSQGEHAKLYTITFNEDVSEFEKFISKFKDHATLQNDYRLILLAIEKILQNGALERYFRPEGKFKDNVCALPIETNKLRLYCLRLSDKILIAGNGGAKQTRTYQESEELKGYVIDLQKFDDILKVEFQKNSVTIEEFEIGINEKEFEYE